MAGRKSLNPDTDPFALPTLDELNEAMLGYVHERDIQPAEPTQPTPPSLPVIRDDAHGLVWVGNIAMSETGLLFGEFCTEEEWREFYPAMARIKSSSTWFFCDYFQHGISILGKTPEALAVETKLSVNTVKTYASLGASLSPLIRVKELLFAHHRKVATLPVDDQIKWLKEARKNGWSAADLGRALGIDKPRRGRGKEVAKAMSPVRKQVRQIVRSAPDRRSETVQYLRQLADDIEKEGQG